MNVLKPTINTVSRMKKELAETAMRRLQLAIKARPDIMKNYIPVVGEDELEILKMAEKDAVQYGMTFESRPSEKAKADLITGAQLSLQQRREGKAGLSDSMYFYIVNSLENGSNIKELASLMDYMIIKSQQEIDQKQQDNIRLQNEGLAQIEQQKQQNAQQAQQGKTQGELMVEEKKTEGDLRKIAAEKAAESAQETPV
jgi:hypothetical protein